MGLVEIALIVVAGLAAGFVAGLVGLGGGIVFAPVLFFYFEAIGVEPGVLAPLTIGTSLFCTVLAAGMSALHQHREQSVRWGVAGIVGMLSAVAVVLMTQFVTTQPWYDATVFQIVFSAVLMLVVVRMLFSRTVTPGARERLQRRTKSFSWPLLGGIGTAAGTVSTAVGVGGGVVLVPAYANLLDMPIRMATGTSSGTIIIISSTGVLMYAITGIGVAAPPLALGYVDVGHGLLLAIPALFTARYGVRAAHRLNATVVRWSFAAVAVFVAVRLIWRALG